LIAFSANIPHAVRKFTLHLTYVDMCKICVDVVSRHTSSITQPKQVTLTEPGSDVA
jgi:hypothetical protein